MKVQIGIVAGISIAVIFIGFLMFIVGMRITGLAVNEINNSETKITREIAQDAILESELIILEMQEKNYSTAYMSDMLSEANRSFEQAYYAEILRNSSSSELEKNNARKILGLVDWKKISYSDVIAYTGKIKERRNQIYLVQDSISVAEARLNSIFSQEELLTSPPEELKILDEAKTAFNEERLGDSEKLLNDFIKQIEDLKAANSRFEILKNGTINFFRRNWHFIIIFLIISGFIAFHVYKKMNDSKMKSKMSRMKTERKVLQELMKNLQEERFKKNKISEMVYNTRMKKYEEKLQEIKEKLPVLEEKFWRK